MKYKYIIFFLCLLIISLTARITPIFVYGISTVIIIFYSAILWKMKGSIVTALICSAELTIIAHYRNYSIISSIIGGIIYIVIALGSGMYIKYFSNQRKELLSTIERLKQSDEQFTTLYQAVEQSSSTIIITDLDGSIIYANPYFFRLTGYSINEVIGSNPRILKSEKHNDIYYENLWNTILSGQVWHGEFCNKKKNGELYWELASISAVKNQKGDITHFVAVKENITKMKLKEAELKMTKLEAEEANKVKTEFLSSISHEIRTPLNGIIGMLELMKDSELDEKHKNYMEMISISAEKLHEIVNQILDMSKIETGHFELINSRFSLVDMFEITIEGFGLAASEKGLTLRYTIDDKLPSCAEGDLAVLRKILINLIDNAVKFTENGEIDIEANLAHEDSETFTVKMLVKDTGIGIAKEKLKNIFNSFEQLDGTYIRKYYGTGLGLSITQKLVKLMNGSIFVESEEGIGSTFCVAVELKKCV